MWASFGIERVRNIFHSLAQGTRPWGGIIVLTCGCDQRNFWNCWGCAFVENGGEWVGRFLSYVSIKYGNSGLGAR